MNSQFTIKPALRSILLLMGCAGFISVMFFSGSFLYAKEIALVAIIPFLLGLLGENLLLAILFEGSTKYREVESVLKPAVTLSPNQSNTEDNILEKAA